VSRAMSESEQANAAAAALRGGRVVVLPSDPDQQPIDVPASVVEVLVDVLDHLQRGEHVRVIADDEEITTQQAADLLNVSRPYLVGLVDRGEIPSRKVGARRRLKLADVLLYREVGESATLFLQDEHGVGRVTTPMIGAAGTGAALRAVGEACELDPKFIERTVWSELSHTSKLPWYARMERPETFVGRRAAIFGDFTYPLGLGYALAREVGLDVVACGTYLTHLERDFLFHARSFTEGPFVEDDPQEVAGRIEAARPALIVGTELEAPVAEDLGVPLLPLCYPAGGRPFVERPLMGYGGSSILADRLDEALR